MNLSRHSKVKVNRVNSKSAANALNSVATRFAVRKRSGLELAGAFIFIGALTAVGVDLRASDAHAAAGNSTAGKSQPAAVDLQINHTSQSSAAPSPDASHTSSNDNSSSSTRVESTTDESGSVSTHVTVNGQPVDVPANSSSQHTVNTPDGNTTVNISNQQSTAGDSRNSTNTRSSVHISSSTTSRSSEVNSVKR